MPTIDTTQIAGYEAMTAEEKLAALEEYELPEPDYTGYVTKKTYDTVAKELSTLKKNNSTAQTTANEQITSLQEEVASLKKASTIAENKAQLIALGYSEELAADTANAMFEGDTAKVFANQKAHLEAHENQVKANLLKKTPTSSGGNTEDQAEDYQKKIAEAQARGDFASVAYFTRLKFEAQNENKT